MVSWLLFENRSDVGTFKRRWEFWRTYWFIKLNTNKFCKVISIFFLKLYGYISAHFLLKILSISVSSEALVARNLKISFKTAFLSMQEKLKLEAWWNECDIDIILGCFLYFKTAFRVEHLMFSWKLSFTKYLGISRFLATLEKKILR